MAEKTVKLEDPANNRMGSAKMLPLILTMALPAMFSMLIQALYNIVDSYFVAQVSQNALTAVSLAFPIQNLLVAFGVGTGVGVSSLISRRLGERDQEAADNAATHGIILSAITYVVFAVFGAIVARPFTALYTQDAEVLSMGMTYITIVTVASFGFFFAAVIEKMLQATGNMVMPMIIQLVGAVANIIFDPILIFNFNMGVAGAAYATVGGQILSMIVGLCILFFGNHAIALEFKGFRFHGKTMKDIYVVGLPSIVMNAIGTLMTMAMNGILAGFSAVAVNVFGVYFKLQSFVFMPVFGLNNGMVPIISYNYGAARMDRVKKAVKLTIATAICIMLCGLAAFQLIPSTLLSFFNASPEMLEIGNTALRIISLHFPLAGFAIIAGSVCQAIGNPFYSLIVSVCRQLLVLLPVAWLLAQTGRLGLVWLAFLAAEIVSVTLSAIFLRRTMKAANALEAEKEQ